MSASRCSITNSASGAALPLLVAITWASLLAADLPSAVSVSFRSVSPFVRPFAVPVNSPSADGCGSNDYIITSKSERRASGAPEPLPDGAPERLPDGLALPNDSGVWLNVPDDHLWRIRTMSGTPVITRPTGRPLPRIALGCGNFGGVGSAPEFFGRGLTTDQALAMMDAAWESGITHFDTADAYGGGRSEAAIGRWITTRGIRPQLTTKTCNPMRAGAEHGLAPERVARQLRASLDRLGVDRVELYLAHDFDPDVPLADTFGAFAHAQAEGSVGDYAVSNFDAAQLMAALAAGTPRAVQNNYSLL